MIGLTIAVVVLTAVAYVLLRHADRWGRQPPWEPPAEFVAQMRRMSEAFAKVGTSFAEMVPAMQRVGDTLGLAGETWVLALHAKLPDRDVCRLDAKDWPCPEHERLTASIKTRRERLRLTDPKLSADATKV